MLRLVVPYVDFVYFYTEFSTNQVGQMVPVDHLSLVYYTDEHLYPVYDNPKIWFEVFP